MATAATPRSRGSVRATTAPALLLGLGLGAFVDGIVLHQLLQWHHILSATGDHPMHTVAGLEANTLADGVFHAAAWVLTAVGALLAIRRWRDGTLSPSWRVHVGGLVTGWGAFNVVEALVNHHLLGLHHVRDDLGGPASWDYGWLAGSAVLLAVGLAVLRPGWRTEA